MFYLFIKDRRNVYIHYNLFDSPKQPKSNSFGELMILNLQLRNLQFRKFLNIFLRNKCKCLFGCKRKYNAQQKKKMHQKDDKTSQKP